jgi:hypothetical protein
VDHDYKDLAPGRRLPRRRVSRALSGEGETGDGNAESNSLTALRNTSSARTPAARHPHPGQRNQSESMIQKPELSDGEAHDLRVPRLSTILSAKQILVVERVTHETRFPS